MKQKTTIVVPCYNEAERFSTDQAIALVEAEDLHLLLVNDGSTDETQAVLEKLANEHPDRVAVLHLSENVGKAEAVRQGLIQAVAGDSEIVGYLDGDFATPSNEMLRLVSEIRNLNHISVLLGSRWMHLGADIKREPLRHYGGRVFATLASRALRLPVYDTQCGAKLFRVGDPLSAAIALPFELGWAFDVELIGRLRHALPQDAFHETPLNQWINVAGSKISLSDMIFATLTLFRVRSCLARFARHSN